MNNVAINICIGLIFIFLLYSLLATIIQEIISKFFGLRARMLLKAISKLLDDDSFNEVKYIGRFKVILNLKQYVFPFHNRVFTEQFYHHPAIKYLGQNELSRKPAYISSRLFADTLIKILRGSEFTGTENQLALIKENLKPDNLKSRKNTTQNKQLEIPSETKNYLLNMVYDCQNDIEKFRILLEEWYDEMMDRAGGWYKKQTRLILFFIGFTLALIFNVDTIRIAQILREDKNARESIVKMALELKTKDSLKDSLLVHAVKLMKEEIEPANTVIGIGHKEGVKKTLSDTKWKALVGWLITALAISLGAPFWFDVLQKFMAIRQSGNKPVEIVKGNLKDPENKINRVG